MLHLRSVFELQHKLSLVKEIPEAMVKYYTSMIGTDEPVFNYQFVPHILYKGNVDISGSEIISIKK